MDLIESVRSGFEKKDFTVISIAVATFVVIITVVLYWIVGRRRNLQRGVLMVGLSGAGKTLLFSRLVASKNVETYTSMKENSSSIKVPNKGVLKLIDLPGNERLRSKYLDEFKSCARGFIFVIDSLSFSREIRDVAELLYTVLSERVVSHNCPPFLIVCNKQDETMAKSSKVIQSQLEKEINMLRVTKNAMLDSTDDTGNNNTYLGRQGKDFQFADLKPVFVEFAESIARESVNNEIYIKAVSEWLCKIA
ncbi:signal recognition particle receptor subunit beta-like [Limulus polyphemus]|uniref:Signal recognition particle receptor subunit beta n=1 Tax=Limulus polyphemus TaxID=6850 RepID=A0ABM1BG05_LIMPO|nr:signal recognition particle receptor subunit beta-like [Limulus polyphemus]